MESYFPHLWIDRKERQKCLAYTARATGIRVRYASKIDALVIDSVNSLISFLRKRYFFPVRCNLYFTNHERYHSQEDGHVYYGIFRDNEKAYPNRAIYPEIFIAAKLNRHWAVEDIMLTLLHELTHYYQWFFDEYKDRSGRSIEAEATKWANWILSEWKKSQNLKTPFGTLNIYVDNERIDYLPLILRFDHPTCKDRPLAACYRLFGSVKGNQSVKCVIEPAPTCEIVEDSGENYLCQSFIQDHIQLTVGTLDPSHLEKPPYEVRWLSNGLLFTNLAPKATVKLGVAWVTDASEHDLRTYFAADPS